MRRAVYYQNAGFFVTVDYRDNISPGRARYEVRAKSRPHTVLSIFDNAKDCNAADRAIDNADEREEIIDNDNED